MNSQSLPPTSYTMMTIYVGFLLIAGIISQSITTKVLLLKENRTKHLTPYLLNIVASNALVILGSFPTTFFSSLNNGWYFGDGVCRANALFTGIGCIAMIATVTCITVKIYFIAKHQNLVVNPGTPTQSDRSYIKILIAIWVYSILAIIPPIVGLTDVVLDAANTSCVPDWAPKRLPEKIYIMALTTMAYVLPVAVSCVYLWKTRLALSLHINLMNNRFMYLRLGNLKTIYRMSGFAILCFTISWLPYGLYVLTSVISGRNVFSVEATMVPALTAKTSVIVSPFIYAIVLPRFRNSILTMLRIRRRGRACSPDLSNCVDRPLEMVPLRINRKTKENNEKGCSTKESHHSANNSGGNQDTSFKR